MRKKFTYIVVFLTLVSILYNLAGFTNPPGKLLPGFLLYAPPPDSTDNSDTTLIFPFRDNSINAIDPVTNSPMYLKNPSNVQTTSEYDPEDNEYTIRQKIGKFDYRLPYSMDRDEYLKYDLDRSVKTYWSERAKASGAKATGDGIIPQIFVGGSAFETIFGSNTIDIRPQGSAELTFGILSNRRDDPTLNVRQRKVTNFDFQQKIQMSVLAKIGDKIEFQVNYNTEATFEFENKLNLKYEGKEDEIIQLIEAGNVTLPLTSTLITGSQALFGIKTKLKFGRTTVTAVYSEQKSETSNITVQGGAQTNRFTLNSDQYEENKHFLLAQYFRNNYDAALTELPIISSNVNITKIEVWVTNIGAAVTENRNIVAFQDLGENEPYNKTITGKPGVFPDNEGSNNLYEKLMAVESQVRDINQVSTVLTGPGFYFTPGIDAFKVESARKLNPNEFSFNSKLGFISLSTTLNSDQVLAVAYQYNVIGDTTIYQVGEFSDQGINSPLTLMVKLLKSTTLNTNVPIWDLMMKNVYAIGAYQVQKQDFILNILYSGNENGVPTSYLTEAGDASGVPLIRVLNFDNLDQQLNPPYDGIFDFIDMAATQGGTIQGSNGRVYFTCLEPFGSYLRTKIGNQEIANKFAYDSLYTLTKNGAQQYPEKNKFILEGFYKSSSGSEIALNALNVPQGSVKVTAGGAPLVENVDYTVDYTLGRVKIMNEGVLNSGTPINISLESQSYFNIQTKRLMGTHIEYKVNKDFILGGTVLNMTERPLTQKVNYGDEPISNTIWGMNFAYQTESRFITKLVDKLPFIKTNEPSKVIVDGEFAHFIPGHSKTIGGVGTSYIDNFEGSKSTIDLKNVSFWYLASTPQKQTQPGFFPEAGLNTNLAYGYNRAKLAWYIIDPLFYDETGNLRPPNITLSELSDHDVRQILETEVFPNKEVPNGIPTNIPVLNLSFYPSERGPYNYDVNANSYSAGLNEDGTLANPESRWGGIMRKIESTDFEATNVEYIEFWMMDPFTKDETNTGELYFNLGDISEDILRDSRKSFEHGLPASEIAENVDTTIWGRVPTQQALVDNFSNEAGSRAFQDVGYDGLRDEDELSFFDPGYLQAIASKYPSTSIAYQQALADPSSDNYHYFRGGDFDQNDAYSSILERYKYYNGTDGNSPTDEQNPEAYPTSATSMPNIEDINKDNTLSENERYFQYRVELDRNKMNVGENFITDVFHAQGIRLPNGEVGDVNWYQFKIPVRDPQKIIGGIQDFQSIRFMRMFMKGFERPMILRFATLELVRGEWRRYRYDLLSPGEYIPNDVQSGTAFDILSVNIEENGRRQPIPYVIPPGIEREINIGTTNLQQLNEQSMVLRVCDLIDGDARGAYKTTDFDFREYGKLQMFVHAEKLIEDQIMNDGDLTIFVRIGSDLIQNYYEYEIPLKFTPWFTSPSDLNAIWPEENRFDIDLERLVNFKQERNIEMRKAGSGVFMNMPYYTYDGPNKVTILGSPSISDVKAMMIGIRNPKKTTFNSNDDGESKCAEIWVNELRLTDFNSKSGLAATGRIKTDLADLGNVTLSGLYSTPGYGSIEKKTNERSKEFTRNFDISTNLELGKFFPEKFGIRLPMHFDYSEARLTPKYNQLDPDVILKDDLKNFNTLEQDSLKALNENFIMRKNLNFINVRKDRVGASSKSHFYDIENWDFTYSYSEIYSRNVDIEYELHRTYRGGIGYNFNNNPKNYKPFNNVKFLKGKTFALIRDFNFYVLPKLFSFRTDMDREYSKRVLRNKSQYDVIIEPTYLKKWDWMRNFDLKYDLATSLKLDYTADIVSYVDELPGGLEKDDPTYDLKQEQIKSQLLSLGTKSQYNHNLAVNYTIPINKLPLLDWLNASARYQTNYKWMASPISIQDRLGNQIENSNSIQLNGTASLDKFYNYFPFLKKVNENKKGGARMPDPKAKQKPTPEDKAVADTTKTKPKTNYAKIVGNGVLKLLMSFKRASLSYTEGNGIYMPGFKPQPGLVGNNWGLDAPGLGFVFGSQEDIRYKAVQNGWLTTDTLLNTAYMTKFNQQLSFRGSIEPIADFKIELTADRTYSENHQEYFKSDANGDFSSFSPVDQGSFSMSIITWKTAWTKDNDKDENQNFENLKESRLRIAQRLAENNPNYSGNIVDSTGFPEGYGPTQQNVLLFSFLSAYTGKDAGVYTLNAMPSIPQLNWRITYNGLSKIPALKKYLRSVTITHGYRSTYSINSFQSNILYKGADGYPTAYDGNNNFISELQISQVSIMEQYSPLITFDMTWINSLMTKFEIKKTRNLSMSFANNQLTEVTSNEFVIGTGYRIKDVKFGIRSVSTGSLSNVKSDLNLRGDFSIRRNKTVLRRIDEDVNQVSTGQQVLSINLSADYMVNTRLNIRVFFDKVINDPYVSSQFHNSTTNGGVSLKFTLAQ